MTSWSGYKECSGAGKTVMVADLFEPMNQHAEANSFDTTCSDCLDSDGALMVCLRNFCSA